MRFTYVAPRLLSLKIFAMLGIRDIVEPRGFASSLAFNKNRMWSSYSVFLAINTGAALQVFLLVFPVYAYLLHTVREHLFAPSPWYVAPACDIKISFHSLVQLPQWSLSGHWL